MFKNFFKSPFKNKHNFSHLLEKSFHQLSLSNRHPIYQAYSKNLLHLGIRNYLIFNHLRHWCWPKWVSKQLDPHHKSHQQTPSPYLFHNQHHCEWRQLSLPGYHESVCVDSQGRISMLPDHWSLETVIEDEQQQMGPDTFKSDGLNYFVSSMDRNFLIKNYRLNQRLILFESIDQTPSLAIHLELTNQSLSTQKGHIYLAIRPYSFIGMSEISNLSFLSSSCFFINNQPALIFNEKAQNILCLASKDGDALQKVQQWHFLHHASCHLGACNGLASFAFQLNPEEKKLLTFYIPLAKTYTQTAINFKLTHLRKIVLNKKIFHFSNLTPSLLFENAAQHSKQFEQPLTQFFFPHLHFQQLQDAAFKHLLSHVDTQSPIPLSLNMSLHRQQARLYIIKALSLFGGHPWTLSSAQQIYDLFQEISLKDLCLDPDSTFENIIFILSSLKKENTADQFEKVLQKIIKIIFYFQKKLIPVFNQKETAFFFPDNFSSKTTLQSDVNTQSSLLYLSVIKHLLPFIDKDNKNHQRLISLKKCLEKNLDLFAQRCRDFDKSRDLFLASNPNLHCDDRLIDHCYTLLFDCSYQTKHPLIKGCYQKLLTLLDPQFFIFNVHFQGYITASHFKLVRIMIKMKDSRAFSLLECLSDKASLLRNWPEVMHPLTFKGTCVDADCKVSSSLFLLIIRDLLIDETEHSLYLLPMLPSTFLPTKNQTFSVRSLICSFGTIDLCLSYQSASRIHLLITPKFLKKPEKFSLNLPFKIKGYEEENTFKTVDNNEISLSYESRQYTLHLETKGS